ncbi:MAG: insulinase family protein [Alistipes sp.]|nr:insulinase family protein [Alistipes sp.]
MKRLFFVVVALVMTSFTGAWAQMDPMQPVPADENIRVGKLENGLTYYIRHNAKPEGMGNFYIVHDVGAIQENDNQQGLAHFLEHMAFNGTKNFPDKSMIEYLESVGIKFGANLNAFTSWDLTQYFMTDVPVNKEGVVDNVLTVLHDWSHFILLEQDEIDSERGVIKEELRTRDGAAWRSTIAMLQAVGKGTLYAERNLIGYLEGLESFTYDDIRTFYDKWYRPDYQAIVVVGDIDVDEIEAKIKTIMADIPAPAPDAAQKDVIVVPDNEEPIVSIFTDPEQQYSQVNVIYKSQALPKEARGLVLAELLDVMTSLMDRMAAERLQDMSEKPNAPFINADFGALGGFGICPTLNVTVGGAMTKDGEILAGYKAILTEMERIRRWGFTDGEFERAKAKVLASLESSYNSRDDRKHAFWAQRCIDNFREGTPMPSAEQEYQLDKQLVEMLNVAMINQAAQQLYQPGKNMVIIVNSPEKEGVAVPTEAELLAALEEVVASDIEAMKEDVVIEPLIAEDVVLKGSKVKKVAQNEAMGTTEWTLKNGVKVVLKQTDYEADRIRLSAISDGGTALFCDGCYWTAQLLSSVMSESGISKFSASDLRKQLSGKVASANTSVDMYEHAVTGQASLKDVETMLQLVYLQFTAPRFDQTDFDNFMTRISSMLANQETNPDFIFSKELMKTIYGDSPRRQQISTENLAKVKFDKLAEVHSKLYSNAKDFTFYFIGNMSPEELQPLVEKYIGSLPVAKKVTNKFTDDGVRVVRGGVVNDFRQAMKQPKVSVLFYYVGDEAYALENQLTMEFFSSALDNRYLKSIREEKGGTYGVGVRGSLDAEPVEEYSLLIQFDTNEQMADELSAIVVAEIEKIAAEGPLAEDMDKTREFLLKDYTKQIKNNSYWSNAISEYYDHNIDVVNGYEDAVKAVSAEDVQALAKKILEDGNLIKVVMRPEKAE